MAEKDILTKILTKKSEFFADVFNAFEFDGNQKVDPKGLVDIDTTTSVALRDRWKEKLPTEQLDKEEKETLERLLNKMYNTSSSKQPFWTIAFSKSRDVLKSCIVKKDSNSIYCVLGIENQTAVDATMVTRMLLYDSLILYLQAQGYLGIYGRAAEKYSEEGCKLIPVRSIVLYWGEEEWEGEKDLADMFDKKCLLFFNDSPIRYKVKVVNMRKIESCDKIRSADLKSISQLMPYVGNIDQLINQAKKNPVVSQEVADVIGFFSEYSLEDFHEGGFVNMAKALYSVSSLKEERDKALVSASSLKEERDEAKKERDKAKKERDEALVSASLTEQLLFRSLAKQAADSNRSVDDVISSFIREEKLDNAVKEKLLLLGKKNK